MKEYPMCNICGSKMTKFDGWAWYTCPECGQAIRDNMDGSWSWQNELFRSSKSKRDMSDFELADYCRGGELTED